MSFTAGDSTESLPLTTRSSSDTPPRRPSPGIPRDSSTSDDVAADEQEPMLARTETSESMDDLGDEGPNDDLDDENAGVLHWDEWDETAQARTGGHGRKNRRVYGGGRHGDSMEGGDLGPGEVAGMILASSLSPTPLLLPHAAALLGLPIFIPLLFITAGLVWFAYIVLGLEGRYTGSRSWPSLASASFPHRLGLHRVGELLASVFIFLGSYIRGVLGVIAASEISVAALLDEPVWQDRAIVIGIIAGLWVLIPLALLPLIRQQLRQRPVMTNSATAAIFRLPAYVALVLWPLALLVLGVRLKRLPGLVKRELTFPTPPPPGQDLGREAMGLSVWGGISLVVYSLSCHHDTFYFVTALARPSSTASRRRLRDSFRDAPPPSSEGRRNQWPLASALGVAGATLIQLGWGLVGYLGLTNGGREGNILSSPGLPQGDGWLMLVRSMVLLAVILQLESSLKTAYTRIERGLRIDGDEWHWQRHVARLAVWVLIVALAVPVCSWGNQGEGMVSLAEIAGCLVTSLLGFVVPAFFFIALFHLRKPRSIFISDPSDPSVASDTLLLRKERQVQRRLSGRRIWQDVLVFGGLLPFGLLVLGRGTVALATGEDYGD